MVRFYLGAKTHSAVVCFYSSYSFHTLFAIIIPTAAVKVSCVFFLQASKIFSVIFITLKSQRRIKQGKNFDCSATGMGILSEMKALLSTIVSHLGTRAVVHVWEIIQIKHFCRFSIQKFAAVLFHSIPFDRLNKHNQTVDDSFYG